MLKNTQILKTKLKNTIKIEKIYKYKNNSIFFIKMDYYNLEEQIAEKCISFGDYTLSSGKKANYYVDMRHTFQDPVLMDKLASRIADTINSINQRDIEEVYTDISDKTNDFIISGVPFGTVPISSLVAQKLNTSFIMPRKSQKQYGSKKSIEGVYKEGDKVIVIEDVVTTGNSLIETLELIKSNGLIIKQVIIILDRQQGGMENIKQYFIDNKQFTNGLIISLFSVDILFKNIYYKRFYEPKSIVFNELIKTYKDYKLMDAERYFNMKIEYLKEYVYKNKETEENAGLLLNNMSKVLEYILTKKSNLCVAIDETNPDRLIEIVKLIAPHVVVIKIHHDIWDTEQPYKYFDILRELAKEYKFLIMDDSKIADIGNISLQKVLKSPGDLITIHSFSITKSMLNANLKNKSLIMIESMSHDNAKTSINTFYETDGNNLHEVVIPGSNLFGLVTQDASSLLFIKDSYEIKISQNFITMTPGVRLNIDKVEDQNYMSLDEANARGTDIIIVGRDIWQQKSDEDIIKKTIKYKEDYWNKTLRFPIYGR